MSEGMFDGDLKARLRVELDRVHLPNTAPRYLTVRPRSLAMRLAPAALAMSLLLLLAITAFAATGSPNPRVWGQDVVTVIQASSTTPTPTLHAQPKPVRPAISPRSTERPEPSESPQDNSGEGSSGSSGSSGPSSSSSSDGSGGGSHDGGTSDSGGVERS